MRERLQRSLDRFVDVRGMGDREVAQMLRDWEIDIAVDIKGFANDCRTGILSHRPAPIQANYLGWPGTMGADYIDYIIADPHVIPTGQRAWSVGVGGRTSGVCATFVDEHAPSGAIVSALGTASAGCTPPEGCDAKAQASRR